MRTLLLKGSALLLMVSACTTTGTKDTGVVNATGPAGHQVAHIAMTSELTFVPNHVRALVGTLDLVADNTGEVPHNLVFDDASLGRLGTVAGKTSAHLVLHLSRPGSYSFQCTFHPRMGGSVVVVAAGGR